MTVRIAILRSLHKRPKTREWGLELRHKVNNGRDTGLCSRAVSFQLLDSLGGGLQLLKGGHVLPLQFEELLLPQLILSLHGSRGWGLDPMFLCEGLHPFKARVRPKVAHPTASFGDKLSVLREEGLEAAGVAARLSDL